MEKVVAQLTLDHAQLKRIIKSLEHPVERYMQGAISDAPDLNLIRAAVEYAVRSDQYHHPLEETLLLKLEEQIADHELQHMFITIRQQHVELDNLTKNIAGYFSTTDARGLVPTGKIISEYSKYAAMQLEHLETEDTYFYPMIEQLFSSDELEAIQARFGLRDDPLFGVNMEDSFKPLQNFILAYETQASAVLSDQLFVVE